MSKRSALAMSISDIVAHQQRHGFKVPAALLGNKNAIIMPQLSQPKGKLRSQREPNKTERDFALYQLEPQLKRGEIEHYGFEEITLRWSGMTYTPDYFVIVATGHKTRTINLAIETVPFVGIRFIEVKGGHRWEDSIIKFKAARDRFDWARFELWEKVDGVWVQQA